jgi:serine/threonine protein kinase
MITEYADAPFLGLDLPQTLGNITISSYDSIYEVPYFRDPHTREMGGAFGRVFRATRTIDRDGRPEHQAFAVKQIAYTTPAEKQKASREANLLRKLCHPNIVSLEGAYVVNKIPGVIYLVTSPYAQMTLGDFFKYLSTSETCALSSNDWYHPKKVGPWKGIVEGTMSGLQYIHSRGIRHRDLKPDNILLHCPNGQKVVPILIDFGISKRYVGGAATTFNGSWQWYAPEWIDESQSTPKVDVFALGECFTPILAIVLAGRDGLLAMWEMAFGTGNCQFASNLEALRAYFKSMSACLAEPLAANGQFKVVLSWVVEAMIRREPLERPTMDKLQEFYKLSSSFLNYRHSNRLEMARYRSRYNWPDRNFHWPDPKRLRIDELRLSYQIFEGIFCFVQDVRSRGIDNAMPEGADYVHKNFIRHLAKAGQYETCYNLNDGCLRLWNR